MSAQTIGKLYGPTHVPKTMKIITIAKLNGLEVETVSGFNIMEDTKKPDYLAKFPLGQSPGFEAKDGFCLSESAAIAIYIAELNKQTTLLGSDAHERAKIFQYIFNNETQVDKFASQILYPKLGYMKHDPEVEEINYEYLDRNFEFYNNELSTKEYLVGDKLTLADIFLFFSLIAPYKIYLSDERKQKYSKVTEFVERLKKVDVIAKVLKNAEEQQKY